MRPDHTYYLVPPQRETSLASMSVDTLVLWLSLSEDIPEGVGEREKLLPSSFRSYQCLLWVFYGHLLVN